MRHSNKYYDFYLSGISYFRICGLYKAAFRFPTRVHPGTQKAFRFLLSAFIGHLGGTFRFLLYPPRGVRVEKPPGSLSREDWVIMT
ncbi:hypothetical protein ALC62_02867 [Cyphomyrmex costatus]|uniref:Uncharacterized protein n=1 Tax=Cyphomyrmex costatus TaxID=456900 RepID=A0A151IMX9_9HYME|nr:hypothetical protein ALC62_02867 [Cyphomyrmex costatus]